MTILRPCRGLIAAIDVSGQGITSHPDAAERAVLQGLEEVVNAAAARPDSEGRFDQIRQAARLSPSSIGLLSGVLRSHDAQFISPEPAME